MPAAVASSAGTGQRRATSSSTANPTPKPQAIAAWAADASSVTTAAVIRPTMATASSDSVRVGGVACTSVSLGRRWTGPLPSAGIIRALARTSRSDASSRVCAADDPHMAT